jgi:hypothetical protein
MSKLDEIDERFDAVGLIVSLIINAAVSHQHELPRLTQGDSGAESPLRLVVEEVPEYEPL